MDEITRAISFANSYFALVDGLASGLESHLAEDVVLDWFGRTIKGRKNVCAFMETHKVSSRHRFSCIAPATGIAYRKESPNRCSSARPRNDTDSRDGDDDVGGEMFFRETETPDVVKDYNHNEIDAKEMNATGDVSYDLREGDLSNLFKLEITSTNIEEIERSINRIKLEEEMARTIKANTKECGEEDELVVVETSAVKYVEADGEIEFSRKCWKKDTWNPYFFAVTNVHTWRRPCKLQIAYTVTTEHPILHSSCRNNNVTESFEQAKSKLPSLEEIGEISNRLVPNTNHFGGFLRHVDFFEDRKGFLERLEAEMATKEPCTPSFAPKYLEHKLVFDKPCVNSTGRKGKNNKTFVFNYQIHLIIYEGGNKCKANLLRENETTKV